MDPLIAPYEDVNVIDIRLEMECHAGPVVNIKDTVDELSAKVENLEHRLSEIEHFYSTTKTKESNTPRSGSLLKDKERQIPSMKKIQQDTTRREAAAAKRMQEIMRQFGSILRQITQLKWAWPFMQPVDVEGLGLHDYYKIIDRPMDFSTIKNQMEANDGTGYRHVREIYADVRLIFKNAMKYNDKKSDVYFMAQKLMEKFEEKWLQLLPKVTEEENRREAEEAEAQLNIQLVQEAAHAKLARDLNNELYDVDMDLEQLREMVVKSCRRITIAEKRKLGDDLSKLCTEDLRKALEIIAQGSPNFDAMAEDVEVDLNAQSESTLWRLKFFVKDVLNNADDSSDKDSPSNQDNNFVSKRKREICNALAKTAKRQKKPAS